MFPTGKIVYVLLYVLAFGSEKGKKINDHSSNPILVPHLKLLSCIDNNTYSVHTYLTVMSIHKQHLFDKSSTISKYYVRR